MSRALQAYYELQGDIIVIHASDSARGVSGGYDDTDAAGDDDDSPTIGASMNARKVANDE